MKKLFKACILFAGLLGMFLLTPGCTEDPEEEIVPKHPCDTLEVTYSGVIQPLLAQKCYGCHGNGNTRGDVNLGSYEGVLAVANDGRLSGAVNHEPGFTPMPAMNPKLDSCSIYFIDKWIEEGAPNN